MAFHRSTCAALGLFLLAGCDWPPDAVGNNGVWRAANDAVPAPPLPSNASGAQNAAIAPLPLHERDLAGAGRVVERAIALATSGQIDAVRQLTRAGPDLDRQLARAKKAFAEHPDVQIMITGPGTSEGAAGSIYMEIPIAVIYAERGESVRRTGTVTLRRANDVPGATEEQLSWRIVDAKLDPAGA